MMGPVRHRRAALVTVLAAGGLALGALPRPAAAQLAGAGLRAGTVKYNQGIGWTSAYGISVNVPFPIVGLSGSLEYAGKSNVAHEALRCSTCPAETKPYDFNDLAVRVTASVPVYAIPPFARLYVGGGVGEHRIKQPDPAGTDSTNVEWRTDTLTKSSWHVVAGGRVSVPYTRLGGFAEGRVSWIQTDPVTRQIALFIGLALSL